jgi:hypothetical protein
VAEGWNHAGNELRRYMVALEEHGFVDWATFGAEDEPPCPPHCDGGDASDAVPGAAGPPRNEHAFAAGAMLMAALFSDAMGRDVMPELHPQPAERAPALYVRLFLRVVGCAPPCASPERATRGRPADGAAGAKAPARTAAPGRGGRRRAS